MREKERQRQRERGGEGGREKEKRIKKEEKRKTTIKYMYIYILLTLSSISVSTIIHQYIIKRLIRSVGKLVDTHLLYPCFTHLTFQIPTINNTIIIIAK